MNNEDLDAFIPCDVCPDRHDACPGACAMAITFWNLISMAIECNHMHMQRDPQKFHRFVRSQK